MRASLAIAFVLAVGSPALAGPTPWADGVAKADQERANSLFGDANRLFLQQAYSVAIDKYRAALAIWDHPVIRFNLAVALFHAERYVEASEALDGALKFGQEPFSAEQRTQIAQYQAKLREHIGELSASCKAPSARLTLDGQEWFVCPGEKTLRVLAGKHTIVAETAAQHVSVDAGAKVSTEVRYEGTRRRWPTWLPWTIGLSGGAIALASAGIALRARFKQQDLLVELDNCTSFSECSRITDEANQQYYVAKYVTIPAVFGLAGVGTGLVMLYLNRNVGSGLRIDVVTGGSQAGASASWQF